MNLLEIGDKVRLKVKIQDHSIGEEIFITGIKKVGSISFYCIDNKDDGWKYDKFELVTPKEPIVIPYKIIEQPISNGWGF